MYKRIILPLDGSDTAEHAIPYATYLGEKLQIPIELVRVVEPLDYVKADPVMDWEPMKYAEEQPRGGIRAEQMAANVKAQAQGYLEKIAASFHGTETKVSCKAQEGEPVDEIAGLASASPDTLLVMSTHGRSGVKRWLVGSITAKILRTIDNPLLVIRPRDRKEPPTDVQLKSVIVPLDGSELAEQVLPDVISLSKALDLEVTLLRVTPTSAEYYHFTGYIAPMAYQDLAKEVDEEAQGYLRGVSRSLKAQGLRQVDEALLRGHAPTAIVNLARDKEGAMIAMTTRGRTGMGRWILGSVADRVIRESGAPVLLTRAKAKDDGAT